MVIKNIVEQDLDPSAPVVDSSSYWVRRAARAVVVANDGRIPLLHVTKHGYHKLPGGGIDDGEEIEQALARELMEEVGIVAEVTEEIGEVVEVRDAYEMIQHSYCYLAKQTGEITEPEFTEEEIADGFEVAWMKDIDEAIDVVEANAPRNYEGKPISIRDLTVLKKAKELLEK